MGRSRADQDPATSPARFLRRTRSKEAEPIPGMPSPFGPSANAQPASGPLPCGRIRFARNDSRRTGECCLAAGTGGCEFACGTRVPDPPTRHRRAHSGPRLVSVGTARRPRRRIRPRRHTELRCCRPALGQRCARSCRSNARGPRNPQSCRSDARACRCPRSGRWCEADGSWPQTCRWGARDCPCARACSSPRRHVSAWSQGRQKSGFRCGAVAVGGRRGSAARWRECHRGEFPRCPTCWSPGRQEGGVSGEGACRGRCEAGPAHEARQGHRRGPRDAGPHGYRP